MIWLAENWAWMCAVGVLAILQWMAARSHAAELRRRKEWEGKIQGAVEALVLVHEDPETHRCLLADNEQNTFGHVGVLPGLRAAMKRAIPYR